MWLRQYRAIVQNSFTVTTGDPFYLILQLTALLLIALLGCIPGFTYGEHMQLYRDQCQALIFMIGCLGFTFGFNRSITDDIRRGAGSILLSRPIGSTCLIFGKWSGVFISIGILHFSQLTGYLWISEVAYDPEFLNISSLVLYMSVIVVALALGAIRHYLFGGSYVFYTSLILSFSLLSILITKVVVQGNLFFDWQGLESGFLLLLGMIVFSAVLLPISVIADSVMVIGFGVVIFFLGLISEYLINIVLQNEVLINITRSIVPNWQIFWVADRLGDGLSIPIGYYWVCSFQAILFISIYVVISSILHDRMEIHGES